jgi:hypothetical protein
MNEDLKAWLGLNLQDTLINISAVPFLIGFFSDGVIMFILFGMCFLLSLLGLIVYFTRRNEKVSRATSLINKWGSVGIVLIIWLIMLAKILFIGT